MLLAHAATLAEARSHVAALADQARTTEASSAFEHVLMELDRIHGDDVPALGGVALVDHRDTTPRCRQDRHRGIDRLRRGRAPDRARPRHARRRPGAGRVLMYGETGGLLRAELSELLRQHRIQLRIGGGGSHTVPVTTTAAGKAADRRADPSLPTVGPGLVPPGDPRRGTGRDQRPSKAPANPFRTSGADPGPIAALQHALEHSVRTSTASLPTIEELTTAHDMPLVEHWRQLARAAALGEHDFDAGLGHGRLDAQQCQTLVGDVAAIVRGLVVLDQRYANIPGWEKLSRPDRLGWSALACALDASLDPPDYSVDLRGWRPPAALIEGPAKPGLVGVLQSEHNLVVRMRAFPSVLSLRRVVDSQRILSGRLAELAQPVEPALQQKWLAREKTYTALQQELRDIGGQIGNGGLAAAEGASAVSRLRAIPADSQVDLPVLRRFDQLFTQLDARVADLIEDGIRRKVYLARVQVPRIDSNSGQVVAPVRERYIPVAEAERSTLIELVRTDLRPTPEPPAAPTGAARSRAELHAGLVHRPGRRQGPGLAL